MISICNPNLRRGPRLLLKDPNWTLFPEQRIGLIGTNGSGKSSLQITEETWLAAQETVALEDGERWYFKGR